jgi:hypothetical protein
MILARYARETWGVLSSDVLVGRLASAETVSQALGERGGSETFGVSAEWACEYCGQEAGQEAGPTEALSIHLPQGWRYRVKYDHPCMSAFCAQVADIYRSRYGETSAV